MSDLIPTKDLVIRLKSGEYDGGDLMQAWCRLQTLEAKIKELEAQLEAAESIAKENYDIANKAILEKLEYKEQIEALQSSKASVDMVLSEPFKYWLGHIHKANIMDIGTLYQWVDLYNEYLSEQKES